MLKTTPSAPHIPVTLDPVLRAFDGDFAIEVLGTSPRMTVGGWN